MHLFLLHPVFRNKNHVCSLPSETYIFFNTVKRDCSADYVSTTKPSNDSPYLRMQPILHLHRGSLFVNSLFYISQRRTSEIRLLIYNTGSVQIRISKRKKISPRLALLSFLKIVTITKWQVTS
jgi:hypothetical protein